MRGKCDAGLEGDVTVGNIADYFIAAISLRQGYVNGRGLPTELDIFDSKCCRTGGGAAEEGDVEG